MYESYTKQSLPESEYRELVGTAISVFCSNNGFIIENILGTDDTYSWYELIDCVSGRLEGPIRKTISEKVGSDEIVDLFIDIVEMRNRIVHSFRITSKGGEQLLATKTKNDVQFEITEEYLMDFIEKNDELSDLLHEYRWVLDNSR